MSHECHLLANAADDLHAMESAGGRTENELLLRMRYQLPHRVPYDLLREAGDALAVERNS